MRFALRALSIVIDQNAPQRPIIWAEDGALAPWPRRVRKLGRADLQGNRAGARVA
jgi:hypothetical protein